MGHQTVSVFTATTPAEKAIRTNCWLGGTGVGGLVCVCVCVLFCLLLLLFVVFLFFGGWGGEGVHPVGNTSVKDQHESVLPVA